MVHIYVSKQSCWVLLMTDSAVNVSTRVFMFRHCIFQRCLTVCLPTCSAQRGRTGPPWWTTARGEDAPVADWLRAALQSLRRSDFLSHKPGERLVKSAKRQTDLTPPGLSTTGRNFRLQKKRTREQSSAGQCGLIDSPWTFSCWDDRRFLSRKGRALCEYDYCMYLKRNQLGDLSEDDVLH